MKKLSQNQLLAYNASKTISPKVKKTTPKKRDWTEYNKSLVNRGSVELWVKEENWYEKKLKTYKKRGRPNTYSKQAFLSAYALRQLFGLPYRQTEGFINSLFRIKGLDTIKSPSYARLSQKLASYKFNFNKKLEANSVILVDSTGISLESGDRWMDYKWGKSKSSKWLKLHLAFNYNTGQIMAYQVTKVKGENTHDSKSLYKLLSQVVSDGTTVNTVICDKAYDTKECYNTVDSYNGEFICPPQWNANYGLHSKRDDAVKTISYLGEQKWKERTGYARRSLAETGMSQFKALFSTSLTTKEFNSQIKELECRIMLFNEMVKPELQHRNITELNLK